jgi:hypothetical protein
VEKIQLRTISRLFGVIFDCRIFDMLFWSSSRRSAQWTPVQSQPLAMRAMIEVTRALPAQFVAEVDG